MKIKILLLIFIIFCLALCSCNTSDSDAKTSTSSSTSSTDTASKNKYDDIIDFIEGNDYYNAYSELQKLTEEQRKNEYNPSNASKELEEIEKQAYKEKHYNEFVEKIDITTNNFLKYFEIFSEPHVEMGNDGSKHAGMGYYLRLKANYKMADVSMYNSKIKIEFSYTERTRYYTIDSKTDKITLGMYTASDITQMSKHTDERDIKYYYSFYNNYCIISTSYTYAKDNYGKYMNVCEDLVFNSAKGTLYLETN